MGKEEGRKGEWGKGREEGSWWEREGRVDREGRGEWEEKLAGAGGLEGGQFGQAGGKWGRREEWVGGGVCGVYRAGAAA